MRLSTIVGIFTVMLTLVLGSACAQVTPAQQISSLFQHQYSIPSSAFHGKQVSQSASGTILFINSLVYAPVYLPQDAKVTKLSCGGRATNEPVVVDKGPIKKSIVFTLRRNDPQPDPIPMHETDVCVHQSTHPSPPACKQYEDMATTLTDLEGIGFEIVSTSTIHNRTIDNSRYNYYIVAAVATDGTASDIPTVDPDGLPKGSPLFRSVCAPQHPKCYVGFCRIQYCFEGEPDCLFAQEGQQPTNAPLDN